MSMLLKRPFLFASSAVLMLSTPAFAESPMHVDDAGTLEPGGMKLEAIWRKDAQQRGVEGVYGFSPLPSLEVGVAVAQDRDHATRPASRLSAVGLGFKWVPIQNKTGWSLGASLDFGRTRLTLGDTQERSTERESAFNALATWRAQDGHAVHLNLGSSRLKASGVGQTVGTWGMGYEHPLASSLTLTAEVFGQEHSRPMRALGLRYELAPGLKLSGAVGRGDGHPLAQLGMAWEF